MLFLNGDMMKSARIENVKLFILLNEPQYYFVKSSNSRKVKGLDAYTKHSIDSHSAAIFLDNVLVKLPSSGIKQLV